MKRLLGAAALTTLAACGGSAPGTDETATPAAARPACDPDNGGLTLPDGFCALVAASDLGVGRHMVAAPNGDLFVSLRDTDEAPGAVVGLRDTDGDGRFDVRERFGDQGGTGIALRNGYLYHARDTAVVRFPIADGALRPAGPAEVVVTLPEQQAHTAKGLAFDGEGGLYVNVGAPSNACQEDDRTAGSPGQRPCPLLEHHGGVWRFEEDRLDQTQEDGGRRYATGMRQNYAMTWHDGSLYLVQHGRDQLNTLFPESFDAVQNAELPSEELLKVEDGSNFGWPYCYHDWQQGHRVLMPEYGGDGQAIGDCDQYPEPVAAFPGHWAPGALQFYTRSQFPEHYRGGAFIAFQGSWNRAPEPAGGYNVTFQPFDADGASGPYEVFADGFAGVPDMVDRSQAHARPGGIAQAPDGSLYISDLINGTIWRVIYPG